MNILILGAAGFIGTNLAIKLADNKSDKVTLNRRKKLWVRLLVST